MSNYKQLIQKIFNSNDETSIDAIKKLIYVAVNDPEHFSPIAAKLTKLIGDSMDTTQDDQLKKLFLQLLSEIATNYYQHIPASYYNFQSLINLLSDQNAEVRKASHYLLLIFIKKYEKIDEVIQSYLKKIGQNADHWKVIQKIIHSFQSLLVIEPRCITYGNDYELFDQFLELILSYRTHSHQLIQKASDQTVTSFVKNQYTPQVLPKLDASIMKQLVNFANKLNINITSTRQSHKNLHFQDEPEEIQQVKIPQSKPKKGKYKKSVIQDYLQKLQAQSDWKIKLQVVQSISTQLNTANQDQVSEDLVEKMLDLTSDCNFKTCITAMNIILNIVTNFGKASQQKRDRIQDVIIDKICDLKMAVRQIANRILKKLNEKPNKIFNKKILSKLSSCSVVGKQEILNFFQQTYNSSHLNDLPLILTQISAQLLNQNTRIKIKTIDCLVKLSVTNDLNQCKQILQKKLNKVYYDMYLERLKEKTSLQKQQNQWGVDNQKGFNKGMTWQAQRSAPVQNTDKQFMTKVQFGTRKNNQKSSMIDTIDDFTYEKPNKKAQIQTEKKNAASIKSFSGKTANTFDTFQSEQSSGFKQGKKNFNTNSSKQSFLSEQGFKQPEIQQKKIPLKPNPIKKKPIQNNSSKQDDELVIQSKQYINKNFQQDRYTQKYQRKDEKAHNSYAMKKQKIQQKQKPIAKEPFSIKKSTSVTKKANEKKQHQIDYKATYYAAKQQLAPLDSLKDSIKQISVGLSNGNDWNRQFECLNLVRRFVKNHTDSPLFHEHLATIMPQVLNLIDNLRSSLSKNAMIGLSQMCESLKKAMDPFLQPIFVKLFKKAQDANSFIVDQVRKCMTSLCYYCSAPKITTILLSNCQAKAIPVKLKIALCIDKLLQTKDYQIDRLKDNPKIVGMMGNLIADSSAQVRGMIKQTFLFLCQNNTKNQIEQIFKKTSKDAWQKFKKILDKEAKFNNMGFK